jgi:hypothetical protein
VPELHGMGGTETIVTHLVEHKELAEEKAATKDENPFMTPTVEFYNDFDHDGYMKHGLKLAKDKVKVNVTDKKEGEYCHMHQWALVHWKGYDANGKLVEDSDALRKGHPDYFQIGHY